MFNADLKILFISPRNSNEAVRHLMAAVGSTLLLTDEDTTGLKQHDVPFSIVRLPDSTLTPEDKRAVFEELALPLGSVEDHESLQKEMDSVCIYVHTSGSTGKLLSF